MISLLVQYFFACFLSSIHSAEHGLFPNSAIHSTLLNLCGIGGCQVSVEHPFNMAGNTSCFLRIMCANFSLYFHRTSCFSSAHSMCKFHNASRISCSPHYSAHSDERSTYPLSLLNHLLFPIIILH